jgi:hypothetical protein
MSMRVSVTCDGCGRDITYTGNSVDYRLVLACEDKPLAPGLTCVTDMGIARPIDRTHRFCRLSCLYTWTNRNNAFDGMVRAFREQWNSANSENLGGTRAYRTIPRDLLDEKKAEFTAEALRLFPMPHVAAP